MLSNTPLEQIWRFVNPVMLYGRHFGVKGSAARALDTPAEAKLADTEDGRKALALKATLDALKAELKGQLEAKAVFRFFRAGSEGNRLVLFDAESGAEVTAFELPRQPRPGGVCLADFVRPLEGGRPTDNLCLFVVTAGKGIRALSERFKASGDFVKMHGVQALALETAEAYAELLHSRIRSMWGTPDRPDLTMIERFRAEYPGKRYSFGYPACPAPGGPAPALRRAPPRGHRGHPDRRLHDGAGGLGLGAGLPPPGRVLLLGELVRSEH